MSVLSLSMILLVAPFCLGIPWLSVVKCQSRWAFAYSVGFFVEQALFQIVSIPFLYTFGRFSSFSLVFSLVLLISCCVCVFYCKNRKIQQKKEICSIKWYEWIYMTVFFIVVAVQIIRGFTFDITYMSYDDASYVTIASDAIETDRLGVTDYYTGASKIWVDIQRFLPAFFYFPAYLSKLSGISVSAVVHTALYIYFIVLAYIIYWYLACELFQNRDNRLIFMLFTALFYWFGYHSHYSLTFRILGPNYQGKAVLAISLTPLLLTVLKGVLWYPYQRSEGFLLLLLSIAGISLTMWGTGTVIVVIAVPVALSLIRKGRDWKNILYIIYGCATPVLVIGLFFCYRYMV